jgi:hypothetical protein
MRVEQATKVTHLPHSLYDDDDVLDGALRSRVGPFSTIKWAQFAHDDKHLDLSNGFRRIQGHGIMALNKEALQCLPP